MINTLRLTWTRENVTFGNQCYNDNDRDLSKCQPTLAFQTFTEQQDNTGQFRINDGIQFDETLGWFIPSGRGDHDLRIGTQYVVLRRLQPQRRQPERHVQPSARTTTNFNSARSAHLPGSLHHPRRRPEHLLREGALRLRVRAGQVAPEQPAHDEPRRALRPRDHPDPRDRRSAGHHVSGRPEQLPATRRPDLRPRRRQERRARRLRPVLRQDALRADRRALHGHAVHVLVHVHLAGQCGRMRGPATAPSRPIRSS